MKKFAKIVVVHVWDHNNNAKLIKVIKFSNHDAPNRELRKCKPCLIDISVAEDSPLPGNEEMINYAFNYLNEIFSLNKIEGMVSVNFID